MPSRAALKRGAPQRRNYRFYPRAAESPLMQAYALRRRGHELSRYDNMFKQLGEQPTAFQAGVDAYGNTIGISTDLFNSLTEGEQGLAELWMQAHDNAGWSRRSIGPMDHVKTPVYTEDLRPYAREARPFNLSKASVEWAKMAEQKRDQVVRHTIANGNRGPRTILLPMSLSFGWGIGSTAPAQGSERLKFDVLSKQNAELREQIAALSKLTGTGVAVEAPMPSLAARTATGPVTSAGRFRAVHPRHRMAARGHYAGGHPTASFFGDLWDGIKDVGEDLWHGVEDIGHDIVGGVGDVIHELPHIAAQSIVEGAML